MTDKQVLQLDGYQLWPRKFSLEAYQWVLRGRQVLVGYQVSIFVTVVGTLLSVALMCGLAYALSVRKFKWRTQLAFYVYFTMIFSGGLIPWFITCRDHGSLRQYLGAHRPDVDESLVGVYPAQLFQQPAD